MTDQPYTDTDLRAEAARQHATLAEDPDFMGVGEQMEDASVESTDDGDSSLTWTELLVPQGAGASHEAFGEAQRKIHDLINGAADVSDWAVNLGADGLEPHGRAIDLGDRRVRIHFAFAADMSDDDRADLISQLAAFVTHGLT
ncbi:hypothetical protein [Streptomyces sp. B21-083]|uniref:hypothetical protein n=1 Tax=Streptomyces sp. B21-083 TaxID=3039410 RepID=UPI002FEFF5E7